MKVIPVILNDPLSRPAMREALPAGSSPKGKESLPVQAPSPLGEGWEGGIFIVIMNFIHRCR